MAEAIAIDLAKQAKAARHAANALQADLASAVKVAAAAGRAITAARGPGEA